MKLLELFAGYGSQKLALDELGVDVQSTISEIDKYAIQAYKQLHGETKNLGDICKIESLDYYDMWTYSFPCQDLSQAGKQAGIKEGTRSGLLFEVERLLEKSVLVGKQPKYLLLENVKALVSKKFKPDFDRWLDKLNQLGYNNYWQVLNAKDYGVPQNRERVFVVSIRKDVDSKGYIFPQTIKLEKRLKDILESEVDEKFYLKKQMIDFYIKNTAEQKAKGNGFKFSPTNGDCVAKAITTRAGSRMDDNYIEEPLAYDEQNQYIRKDGCVGTLTTDGSSPKHNNRIVEPSVIQIGNFMSSEKWDNPQCGRVYSQEGCSPTLNTCGGGNHEPKIVETNYRIRKLTPRECWRLMGVSDDSFNKLHDISNSQLYKLAGNSIVVDVLKAIFKELLK